MTSRESAAQIGHENLRKLDFSDQLEESGLSDKWVADLLKAATLATKTINATAIEKDGAKTYEYLSDIDWTVRLRAIEIILKLKRKYDPEPINQPANLNVISYVPTPENVERGVHLWLEKHPEKHDEIKRLLS